MTLKPYTGYRAKLIGSLPKHWILVEFADLIEHGPTNGLYKSPDDIGVGDARLFDINGLYSGLRANFAFSRLVSITSEEEQRYLLHDGDILFNRVSVKPEGIGKAVLVENVPLRTVFETNMIRVRTRLEYAAPAYLVEYFASPIARKQIGAQAKITAQTSISQETITSLLIPLPPLAEQRKIAAILSTWDAAITLTEQLIAALQHRKQGLMQRLLTGAVRFPEFEGEEWLEVSINAMGKVTSGGTPDTNNPNYWNGTILWVTPSEITSLASRYIERTERQITEQGLQASSAVLLDPFSILICTRATVGDSAINKVPMATNQGFKNLTPSERYNSEFLYYLFSFNKNQLVRYSSGSTFIELSKRDFVKLKFLVPRLLEQEQVARVLEVCDAEIEEYQKVKSQLQLQKKGLMQRLLTGEIRVQVDDD